MTTTFGVLALAGLVQGVVWLVLQHRMLLIDGERVNRHVRVSFNYASAVRPGANLALRTDPEGGRSMIVEWDRLPGTAARE